MMKKMISALIFTGLMLPTNALAEGITTSLGFGVGPTYGAGLTVRGEKGDWGVQATGLPYYSENSSFFAGGATGFYKINKGNYGGLYASLGVGAYMRSTKTYESQFIETPNSCDISSPTVDGKCGYWKPDIEGKKIKSGGFAVGPGIGMEFNFAENFIFSIELPIAMIFDVNNSVNLKSVVPIPNGALLYKF